ncbi:hypothetical protein GJ496_004527 [Pomphorhynchus laevis]|nr:hypothetical protein GJ496_004527 [Pomphorhynchus laevis]
MMLLTAHHLQNYNWKNYNWKNYNCSNEFQSTKTLRSCLAHAQYLQFCISKSLTPKGLRIKTSLAINWKLIPKAKPTALETRFRRAINNDEHTLINILGNLYPYVNNVNRFDIDTPLYKKLMRSKCSNLKRQNGRRVSITELENIIPRSNRRKHKRHHTYINEHPRDAIINLSTYNITPVRQRVLNMGFGLSIVNENLIARSCSTL